MDGLDGLRVQLHLAWGRAHLREARRFAPLPPWRCGSVDSGDGTSGIFTSGTTSATAGFAASRFASPALTYADTALTIWKRFTWVARVSASSDTTGFCTCATAAARRARSALLSGSEESWFLNTTITRSVTCVDSARAAFAVSRD